MPVKITYNFKKMAKCMTITEYHNLPEEVQDRYLTWSMEQFLRERAAIELERVGGIAGSAKAIALKKAAGLQVPESTAWNPAFYSSWKKVEKCSESSMFSGKDEVKSY
ncbi:hypothetical protein C6P45_000408 [Maudiozyma exigua]|uniref:Uncharacterized protein n=1 Tax=Maudiozyma exigua TaxID=34358 RepID=A0A9P6W8P1_MAUEX|nr:hypothetical protein C6P45_000408 [Kazachstania exigua]